MRAFFLLLTVIALFSIVSGSVVKVHRPTSATKLDTNPERVLLRTGAKPDETVEDEERGVMDVVKKLGASTAKWPKNTYHKVYVKMKSGALNIDKTSDAFLKRSFNPDQVYKWLKLGDGNNGPERALWDLYNAKYKVKHPGWQGTFK